MSYVTCERFISAKEHQPAPRIEMKCDRFVWEPPADDSAAFAEDIRLQAPRTCQLIKTPAAASRSVVGGTWVILKLAKTHELRNL